MCSSVQLADGAIQVSDLTKTYRLYAAPMDRLKEFAGRRSRHVELTALDHVSFQVSPGETFGIVGENGAGKTTLLKLLAGTLTPTSGQIRVQGRVLALLELGIGFHPEFTGRENVLSYVDMVGFPRSVLKDKFEEIARFSELGEFLDRPLQTYSTGMQMRLAFSLVSCLEPDVLVIDEALAVGDLHFQKKCVDRITEFREKGRTIVFCSHSTYYVSLLCDRVIWLKKGRLHRLGPPAEVVPAYEFDQLEGHRLEAEQRDRPALGPGRSALIREAALVNPPPVRRGDDVMFRILVECERDDLPYHVALSLKMDTGRGVFVTGTHLAHRPPICGRRREIRLRFPAIRLMGGVYYAHARVFDETGLALYHEKLVPPFDVAKESLELGVCYLDHEWSVV